MHHHHHHLYSLRISTCSSLGKLYTGSYRILSRTARWRTTLIAALFRKCVINDSSLGPSHLVQLYHSRRSNFFHRFLGPSICSSFMRTEHNYKTFSFFGWTWTCYLSSYSYGYCTSSCLIGSVVAVAKTFRRVIWNVNVAAVSDFVWKRDIGNKPAER